MMATERQLFADGVIMTCGDWTMSMEWIAHRSVELPDEWLEVSYENEKLREPLDRYLDAAKASEPVEFGKPLVLDEEYERWNYQPLVGHEPAAINADVREFFEARTPGAEWRLSWTTMNSKTQGRVSGPLLSRVHPENGVLFVAAGYQPDDAKVTA